VSIHCQNPVAKSNANWPFGQKNHRYPADESYPEDDLHSFEAVFLGDFTGDSLASVGAFALPMARSHGEDAL
jgi:hypothetical protein